jgi:hypothetical protein
MSESNRAAARSSEKSGDLVGSFIAALGELILRGTTIPLGTAPHSQMTNDPPTPE